MKYSTPELVVIGSAAALVLGGLPGSGDNTHPDRQDPVAGIALGLDD